LCSIGNGYIFLPRRQWSRWSFDDWPVCAKSVPLLFFFQSNELTPTIGSVAHNDAFLDIPGGWLDHHYVQLAKQLAWAGAGAGWTFVVTFIIMVRLPPPRSIGERLIGDATVCD
jgi:hypothetical protein